MSQAGTASGDNVAESLDFVRELHRDVVRSVREQYSRAQIALTLDGLVISVLIGIISSAPDGLAATVDLGGPATTLLAAAALASLALSAGAAVMTLYSKHMSGVKPQASSSVPVPDDQLWFYARIAEVAEDDFVGAVCGVDAARETRIRAQQVATMAPIMTKKAAWLNRAYVFATLGIALFVASALNYLSGIG